MKCELCLAAMSTIGIVWMYGYGAAAFAACARDQLMANDLNQMGFDFIAPVVQSTAVYIAVRKFDVGTYVAYILIALCTH